MLSSAVTDIKAFVPAKDLERSKAFYSDLGFTINFSNDQIAELQIGSFRFLLQKFYVAEHAGNFMMSLNVDDAAADSLYSEYVSRAVPIHQPLKDTEDGLRAFEVIDNNGYVLCFGRPRRLTTNG